MVKTEYKKCPVCDAEISGWGSQHLDKNFEAHMEQQHKVKEVIAKAEEVDLGKMTNDQHYNIKERIIRDKDIEMVGIEPCVDLGKMTKDELNDLAAEKGFGKEVKAHWKKIDIIKVIKRLLK